MKNKRNVKQDFAKIFNCSEEDIYIGDIEEYNIYKLKNKKVVIGDLKLSGLISTECLVLPQSNIEFLNLSSLTSAKGFVLPQNVVSLNLSGLTSAECLELPQRVDGYLYLKSLESAKGLKLPIGLDLNNLIVSEEVMAEIKANPELYYQTEETVKETEKGRTR